MKLVLGTRGSALALAQSRQVAARVLALAGVEVEVRVIRTRGDEVQDRALAAVGGKGLFTAELEAALRSGAIDFAVHSMKDLPTEMPADLTLGAVPARADPRDALVGAPLDALPAGARVGTGSPRRRMQLVALRPDLDVRDVRGNVDTRLNKRDRGDYDAVVLAMAGLLRLGIVRADAHPFDVEVMVPAPGQGALAVQCRAGDARVIEALVRLDDAATRSATDAERAFLAAWGGGCNAPVGCHAWGDPLQAVAVVEGGRRARAGGSDPGAIGRALADALKA